MNWSQSSRGPSFYVTWVDERSTSYEKNNYLASPRGRDCPSIGKCKRNLNPQPGLVMDHERIQGASCLGPRFANASSSFRFVFPIPGTCASPRTHPFMSADICAVSKHFVHLSAGEAGRSTKILAVRHQIIIVIDYCTKS